ncbi:klaroid protein-like isoform X2 [Diachasmimorpha longicaudata]
MDSEQHHYELRSRSRSRSHTPMIFNQLMTESESTEHHYDLRSRESRERSHTPGEVTSSRRSGSRSLPASSVEPHDKSMDIIIENREEVETERIMEKDNSAPQTIKKVERRSERQRVKRQLLTNGQGEARERQSLDKSDEKHKSETPKRTITSDYSSEEGEREDPPNRSASAYEIYKQAGDYWNVFPKTDYTYSPASQCRYEIAPGVLAMPNMSRPSIHSDGSSAGSTLSLNQQIASQTSFSTREGNSDSLDGEINESIEQNRLNEENARLFAATMNSDISSAAGYKQVHVEQFMRRRIFYEESRNRRTFDSLAHVDSDSELDDAVKTKCLSRGERGRVRKWYEGVKSLVAVLFFSIVNVVTLKILRRETCFNTSQGYYQFGESKWRRIWSQIDYYLQYLYLWLIRVLYLDTWILSRFSRIRKYILARPSQLLWLILLPPLLFAGFWLLPYAKSFTFPGFRPDVTDEMDKVKMESNEMVMDEEFRRSIALLINRVEKLESARLDQGEQLTNITESIQGLKGEEKSVWALYDEKLTNLEQKITDSKPDERAQNEISRIKLEFKNLQELYAQQKTCCDKPTISITNNDIERRVEEVVTSYFGTGAFKFEITRIVEEIIKANTLAQTEAQVMEKSSTVNCPQPAERIPVTDDHIRSIVKEILKIYDADRTGRVDYALESAGGQIISIRCTQRHNVNTRAYKVLGFTLYYESGDPRTVIQGRPLQPGVCWAFQDFPGYLLIKVRAPIKVTGFTLEHAPRSILPNNEMKSAPRKFNVWGLKEENDATPMLFGEYEFVDSDDSLQYFPVQNNDIKDAYEYIELRIHSNHGQLEYTCLYRFRIHGVPV